MVISRGVWHVVCVDGVDKRGRKVHESSAEDMRRYYHLYDDGDKNATPHKKEQQKKKKRLTKIVAKGDVSKVGGAVDDGIGEDHTHHSGSDEEEVSSEDSGAESDTSTDVEEVTSLKEPEVGVVCGCGLMCLWVWLCLSSDSTWLVGGGGNTHRFRGDGLATGSL